MKKRAAALAALTAALLPLLPSPAGAAVPKTKPTFTPACNGGYPTVHDTGRASVWVPPHGLAAKNPCKYWLAINWAPDDNGSPPGVTAFLAPGAHFNWPEGGPTGAGRSHLFGAGLDHPDDAAVFLPPVPWNGPVPCSNPAPTDTWLVYSYKHVVRMASCG
jgi:hypothetical protein